MQGNYKRDCPQLTIKAPKAPAEPTPARVFAITQADAEASPSLVTGQLSVNNSFNSVLFDSGATHSYVAARIFSKLDRPHDRYESGFGTLLPGGELVISKRWIRSMPIRIDGRELGADLIEMILVDFDIILGMDFLSKYSASIDCKRKMVIFQPEGEEPFIFVGSVQGSRIPIILVLTAKEWLQEGCLVGFYALNKTHFNMIRFTY